MRGDGDGLGGDWHHEVWVRKEGRPAGLEYWRDRCGVRTQPGAGQAGSEGHCRGFSQAFEELLDLIYIIRQSHGRKINS